MEHPACMCLMQDGSPVRGVVVIVVSPSVGNNFLFLELRLDDSLSLSRRYCPEEKHFSIEGDCY